MAIKDDVIESVWNGIFSWQTFEAAVRLGPAYTGWFNGQVMGVGGVMLNDSRGIAWALISAKIPKLDIARAGPKVKRYLDRIIKDYDLTELRATARADLHKAQRYLRFLGFRRTGRTLNSQLDGSANYEYVRTVE